jgi:RNA polymerase sigma-70 factor (family 1)
LEDYSFYTDQQLFAKIAQDDEKAFRVLFYRYQPQLLPFVRELVNNIGDPAEILQETFLKIWKYRSNLVSVEIPKAYIIRIVSNEAAQFMQRQARQNQLLKSVMKRYESGPVTPEQELAVRELAALVQDAIDELPAACREVYILSRDEDLSAIEIAQKLGISKHTVNNQLAKALKLIRMKVLTKGLSTFLVFLLIF